MPGTVDQKSFLINTVDPEFSSKALGLYDSIDCLYRSWGISQCPLVENAIKVSYKKISRNRLSIPVFGIDNIGTDRKKIHDLFGVLSVPVTVQDEIFSNHHSDSKLIIGINFDTNDRRIYLQEGNAGFGYEYTGEKVRLKKYLLVLPEHYPQVIEDLKKMPVSGETCEEVMKVLSVNRWGQVAHRDKVGLVGGYHISLVPPVSLNSISDSLKSIARAFSIDTADINSFSDFGATVYLNWVGFGLTTGNSAEITIYLRNHNEHWDQYCKPLSLENYIRQEVFGI